MNTMSPFFKVGASICFDVGQKVGAVHGAIQHKRGGDAIVPQSTYESCGFPVTVWDLINQPFALGSPPIKAGHLAGRCGFINEDQSFRIKGRLCFSQVLPGGGDVLPVLFGRADTLFLNGSLRWRRAVHRRL
jgi:hypothetical protein